MLAPCNAAHPPGRPGQTVALSLAGNATSILIEVRDSDPRPPQTKGTNDDGASDPTDGVLLPRRVPRARPKPPAEIVTDLDILRRLRDHLMS